jgi:hypothetical protein
MKIISFIVLFLSISSLVSAQNMITNPGFESGTTGWGGWWSRDSKGNATAVTTSFHSGVKALQVNYTGALDWSYPVNKQFTVKTGDLYEISAWVNASSSFDNAQLSVELIDSTNTVINWMYGTCAFAGTNGQYKQFTSSFTIPAKIKKVVLRLMGYGPCNFFVDDVSMILLGKQKLYT